MKNEAHVGDSMQLPNRLHVMIMMMMVLLLMMRRQMMRIVARRNNSTHSMIGAQKVRGRGGEGRRTTRPLLRR